jgi:peptidoglycan/LPS O-acetylase OafA/YrhL
MRIAYRSEIDGLRAIAVVAVILYHSQITIFSYQPFKGGFIGVDIFFVISGYLITSIVLKELITTGSFSLKNFYERRIRRIFPVLLLVMLISLPIAWIYLLPDSFIDFSKSILYSLAFISNFYFHYSGLQYGAETGLLKPFLHTWSLAVEEQYYILFPIILLIIFKYFKRYLIYALILGFIISLGLADWGSKNNPSFSFYVLPTRGWELLAGSILAYFEVTLGRRGNYRTLNLILPSVGFFLIGYSILFFHDKMFHPSFYTLSPIIGVCLIIWFSCKDEPIYKILSSRLFVGIGLISYSLYIWHYPIFAFARITGFLSSFFTQILLGAIILILSITTYYLVEGPARNKKNCKVLIFLIYTYVFLILFNLYIILNQGLISRVPNILKNEFNIRGHLKDSQNENCQNNKNGCAFNTQSNKKIFIVGDSHMATLAFSLKDQTIAKGYQFITSIFGGCLYFPGFNLIDIKTKKISECNNEYFLNLQSKLNKEKKSIIIVGGRISLYLSNNLFNNQEGGIEGLEYNNQYVPVKKNNTLESSFKKSIQEISKNNYVILIYPIPEVGWNVPKEIIKQYDKNLLFSKKKQIKNITTSYQVYKNRNKSSFDLLDSIQGNNIYRVYPHKLFCDTLIKSRCITHDDINIFYADGDHPSIKGAEMINELIIEKIEKIELKFN